MIDYFRRMWEDKILSVTYILLAIFTWLFLYYLTTITGISFGILLINFLAFSNLSLRKNKKRELYYFILPISFMLFSLLWLNEFEFAYVPQFITVCGALISALTAIFISTTKEHNDKEREKNGRKVFLNQIKELLSEIIIIIEKEEGNYKEYNSHMIKNHFNQFPLQTTPFSLLEKLQNFDHKEVYKSFIENINALKNPSKVYLSLIKNLDKATFIKEGVKSQYIEFINTYNKLASKWYHLQLELNEIYLSNQNDLGLKKIAFDFDELNFNGKINLADDILNSLVVWLRKYFQLANNFSPKIALISREIESTMNKINEITDMSNSYFNDMANDLDKICQELNEVLLNLS